MVSCGRGFELKVVSVMEVANVAWAGVARWATAAPGAVVVWARVSAEAAPGAVISVAAMSEAIVSVCDLFAKFSFAKVFALKHKHTLIIKINFFVVFFDPIYLSLPIHSEEAKNEPN